jgi:hypothetical protein
MWEAMEPRPARRDLVYGRNLTWRTNSEELEALLVDTLVARWAALGVPHAGPDVSASAFVVPADFMQGGSACDETVAPPFTDVVHPHIGYQIVGGNGFGGCSWDRLAAMSCLSDAADMPDMVDRIIQHVWGAAVMLHPPLYGVHAAAATAPDGSAGLFVGDSGVGKSSLVTGLALRHGFGYLTADFAMLDGRSLRVYGRPWRLELRAGALREFWPHGTPPGRPVGDKTVLDAREHVAVGASAPVAALFFVRRGDHTALTPLAPEDTRRHLGKPVSMFTHCPDVTRGYPSAFDALARTSSGYSLTLDHDLGIAHAAAVVADAMASLPGGTTLSRA